jgi:hypothetical protein
MVSTNSPSNLFFAKRILDLTYLLLLSLENLYKPRTLNIVAIVLLFELLEMTYLDNIERLN